MYYACARGNSIACAADFETRVLNVLNTGFEVCGAGCNSRVSRKYYLLNNDILDLGMFRRFRNGNMNNT